MRFLRCVGEALVAQGMRGLMGLAPFGEQIYDVAADAIQRYRQIRREQQVTADLQEIIQADVQQIRVEAHQIARDVGAGRSEDEVRQIEAYLTQIPGVARQSLRRPQDHSGTTVPATMNLADPIQLAALLPRRAPRFRIDDVMPHAPQWRFVELLGSGGFGEVWLVRHTFLDQCRAVKFCLDPVGRERLLRHEGEIVKRVMAESTRVKANEHGIVPLVDAYLEGESPWLAYEYVAGGDLAGLIRHLHRAALPSRAEYALVILRVLSRIVGRFHRLPQPIVHRDLKPANILLTKDRLLRITDFGISHIASEQGIRQATISTTSLSLGETYRGAHTPIYASPQQKKGLKADVRDDVHALGIIGYQLLLADLGAERPAGKWRKRVANCGVPDAVLDLLESCWDDDPAERPRDALALAEALSSLRSASATVEPTPTTPPKAPLPPGVKEYREQSRLAIPLCTHCHQELSADADVGDRCPYCGQPPWANAHFRKQDKEYRDNLRRASPAASASMDASSRPPVLPPDVPQFYLPPASPTIAVLYKPRVLGIAEIAFVVDKRTGKEQSETVRLVAYPAAAWHPLDWDNAQVIGEALATKPLPGAQWASVPDSLDTGYKLKALEKAFGEYLYSTRKLSLFQNLTLAYQSEPGESLDAFRDRCRRAAAREAYQALAMENVKFTPRFQELDMAVPDDPRGADQSGNSFFGWLFSAVLPSQDNEGWPTTRKEEKERKLKADYRAKQFEIHEKWKRVGEEYTAFQVKPRKEDVRVTHFGLAWVPVAR